MAKKILRENDKRKANKPLGLNKSNLSNNENNKSLNNKSKNEETDEDINDNFVSFCPKTNNTDANKSKKSKFDENNFYNNFLKGNLWLY